MFQSFCSRGYPKLISLMNLKDCCSVSSIILVNTKLNTFSKMSCIISANNCNCEQHRGKAPTHGHGYIDAVVCLSLHRPVLWRHVPRGRRLDMHGSHGHKHWQILREIIRSREKNPRASARKDSIFGEHRLYLANELQQYWFDYFFDSTGDKRLALPSIPATGDTSRREAIKHSHLPRWQREDVWLWNLGIPRGLCSEDHRRRLQAIYGGESACLNFFYYDEFFTSIVFTTN